MHNRKLDVCLSPELFHLYDHKDRVVIVTDILRATSCMTTAMAYGVNSITPVATVEECIELQNSGMICAAERGGEKVEGFELDNSPYSYMNPDLRGQDIGVTTTNGTMAITKSADALQVLAGSFLNISALADYLKTVDSDLLIFCAGWKGKFNLEDTLFAGALANMLSDSHEAECDAVLASGMLYDQVKDDLQNALKDSSHVQRLKRLNIDKDIAFCLTRDEYQAIPVLKDGKLVLLK
ncbi:2-phosphosulfolactate phosphatase [Roseivirga sp. BDSF3-8]|uniref:2-phosphosulfolactate phosphatase n=1 Tax=Roseivirga sp. BDSF3-8 TaxID=3241598 RepID=UPI0035323B88